MTQHVRGPLPGLPLPRAIRLGGLGVRADASPAELIQSLTKTVTDFKAENSKKVDEILATFNTFKAENDAALKGKADVVAAEKVDRINAALDEQKTGISALEKDIDRIAKAVAALEINGGAGGADAPSAELQAYSKAFNSYFRRGDKAVEGGELALRDLEVKAALTVGSEPDGGYTVMPEMETAIDEVVKEISLLRNLATVRSIGTSEYKKLVNMHGTASGWVGETESRPQTVGPTLSELKFPVMEMYAMPAASQSLLDDSRVNIAQWLADEVQLEFAQKEGIGFISGDGVNKPRGIVGGYTTVADASYSWGSVGYVVTGSSGAFDATIKADCLVDTYHALKTLYRKSASWLANRTTLGATRKLKDGQGNYLLNMVLRPEGFVEEILGRPAHEIPDMPDIAANSMSMAFGDWKRAYLIIDRVGIRVLRDPYTSKPYVLFYTTKRVGGGIQNFEALKLLKFGTS